MNCPACKNEIKGFRDPRSIKEYRISGLCQKCQDDIFGTNLPQICESCGKEIPHDKEIILGNYTVCSDLCARTLVGV